MSIKVSLEFIKESKELLDGIERLTRLMDLKIENIEIYHDIFEEDCTEDGRARAKVTFNDSGEKYCSNYFTCNVHKCTLEHYFDVNFEKSSIYENVGDFGFTHDQVLYLKYGNQNLYIVEETGIFDEVGTIFSETELREWFEEYWENTYAYEEADFKNWLKETVSNGYLKMYLLFDVGNIKYPWEE